MPVLAVEGTLLLSICTASERRALPHPSLHQSSSRNTVVGFLHPNKPFSPLPQSPCAPYTQIQPLLNFQGWFSLFVFGLVWSGFSLVSVTPLLDTYHPGVTLLPLTSPRAVSIYFTSFQLHLAQSIKSKSVSLQPQQNPREVPLPLLSSAVQTINLPLLSKVLKKFLLQNCFLLLHNTSPNKSPLLQ